MDPFSLGLGLSILGGIGSVLGASKSASAQNQITEGQQQAEAIRFKAMKLDADRRRREIIRQSIIARSQALASGTSQGMAKGSALQGAYGQIRGMADWNIQGINQAEKTGEDLFATNQRILSARKDQASASSISAFGTGLSSIGGAFLGNGTAWNRLTNNLQGSGEPFNINSPVSYSGGTSTIPGGIGTGMRGLY